MVPTVRSTPGNERPTDLCVCANANDSEGKGDLCEIIMLTWQTRFSLVAAAIVCLSIDD